MRCKADRGNWPWTHQRLPGHPKFQWTESACRANHPNARTILSMLQVCGLSLHTRTSCTECPWEWHSTYAGNILHEIIYVVFANRGTVNSRVQDLWPLIVEAYRLGSAAARLGGLKGSSRLHQVFPQLKAKATETKWFCRALTFVLPPFNGQADQCHRHTLYASAARRVVFHAPEAIDHCTEHAGTLLLVV